MALPAGRLVTGTRAELAAIAGDRAAELAHPVPGVPDRYALRVLDASAELAEPAPPRRRLGVTLAELDSAHMLIALLAFLATLAMLAVVAISVTGMVVTAIVGMVVAVIPAILGALLAVAVVAAALSGGGKGK